MAIPPQPNLKSPNVAFLMAKASPKNHPFGSTAEYSPALLTGHGATVKFHLSGEDWLVQALWFPRYLVVIKSIILAFESGFFGVRWHTVVLQRLASLEGSPVRLASWSSSPP